MVIVRPFVYFLNSQPLKQNKMQNTPRYKLIKFSSQFTRFHLYPLFSLIFIGFGDTIRTQQEIQFLPYVRLSFYYFDPVSVVRSFLPGNFYYQEILWFLKSEKPKTNRMLYLCETLPLPAPCLGGNVKGLHHICLAAFYPTHDRVG